MIKPEISVIKGERVHLRPLVQKDLPMTLAWRNDEAIRSWFFSSDVVTPQQHRKWFERYLAKDNDFVFIIEEIDSLKTAVGQVSLYNIDWEQKRAEFGRLLIGEPAAKGRGLAKEAIGLLIDFAEWKMGLQEIYLEVYANNLRAIALYRHCGFSTDRSTKGVIRMVRNSNTKTRPHIHPHGITDL